MSSARGLQVAHVLDNLHTGGAQRLLVTFIEELVARGGRVTVVSLRTTDERRSIRAQLEAAGGAVREAPVRPGGGFGLVAQGLWLARQLRQIRPDVVQTHLTYANVLGTAVGRLTGTPVSATLHSTQVGGDGNSTTVLRLETFALRRLAGNVIAVGAAVADQQRVRLGRRAPVVVPNAVSRPAQLGEEQREALRQELLDGASGPLVLAVGRLQALKGFDDLITAWAVCSASLASRQPVLAIAGSGPLAAHLAERTCSLGLHGRVRLLGQRGDVPALLAAADAFVSSSHWEGLPLAVLEAMAAGLPVIATAVGDVPSVIDEAVGLLVPPSAPQALAEALETLLSDEAGMRRRGAAASEIVERRFGAALWVDRLVDAYRGAGMRA